MKEGNKKRPRPHTRPPRAILSLPPPLPSSVSFHDLYLKPHRPCLLKQAGPCLVPKTLALLGNEDGDAEGVVQRLTAILGPECGKTYTPGAALLLHFHPSCFPPSLPWTLCLPSSSNTDTLLSKLIICLPSLPSLKF